ncbi:ribosome modulation factor [Thioalkalivibrio sp. ALJ8]|uniref:ribosome modulation factor n=1 Tax=Thioalkalivibrio sp. ALJ8 TaxID=1158757 RepID=UPI000382B3D7|nr:ribosome modulation factor [Thioalkalivibrio sp. ALJ8]
MQPTELAAVQLAQDLCRSALIEPYNKRSRAYQKGLRAGIEQRLRIKETALCPYDDWTPHRDAWLSGFEDGQCIAGPHVNRPRPALHPA